MLIKPTPEEYGQLTVNDLWRTTTSFLESIRDESNSAAVLAKHPLPRTAMLLICKNPSSFGSREEATFNALSAAQAKWRDEAELADKTLVLELQGRLGNQMFQYAHARALVKRLGTGLLLTHEEGEGAFLLGGFGITCHQVTRTPDLVIDVPGECRSDQPWTWEDQIHQSPATTIKLRGFFQNESCFDLVSDEIREAFFVEPALLEKNGEMPICVQVRRGDFANSAKHEVCHPAYYDQAISLISGLHPNARFHVISDDPEWCRGHLHDRPDLTVLDIQSPLEALATMMACKAFVISNSSFGWWGAWLARSPLVICPTRGLADRHWEMFPDAWIRYPGDGIKADSYPSCNQSARDLELQVP